VLVYFSLDRPVPIRSRVVHNGSAVVPKVPITTTGMLSYARNVCASTVRTMGGQLPHGTTVPDLQVDG